MLVALWLAWSVWGPSDSARRADASSPAAERAFEADRPAPTVSSRAEVIAASTSTAAVHATEPLAPNRSARVLVLDEASAAISGARIELDDAERAWSVGVTSSDGSLEFELPARADEFHVTASRSGFATSTSPVFDGVDVVHTLVLHRGASIRGVVNWKGGEAVGAGVLVVAVPQEVIVPPYALVARATRGLPSVASVQTAADGTFEIVNLDVTKRYAVLAAWESCVSDSMPSAVTPGGSDVVLQLGRLFAVRVRFTDATTGRAIDVPDELIHSRRTALRVDRSVQAFPSHGRWTALAGVDAEFARDNLSHTCSYFFVAEPELGELGPISYFAEFPGYALAQGQFYVHPSTERVLDEVIELKPVASRATGSLRVSFAGLPAGVPNERALVGPEGRVLLWDAQGAQEIALARIGNEPLELAHVLSGRLNWIVTPYGSASAFAFPPRAAPAEVEIGSEPAEIVVDLSRSGALELRLVQVDGSSYRGPARFQLTLKDKQHAPGERVSYAMFDRAPYALIALSPGEYEVELLAPSGIQARTRVIAAVTAGNTASVEARVR